MRAGHQIAFLALVTALAACASGPAWRTSPQTQEGSLAREEGVIERLQPVVWMDDGIALAPGEGVSSGLFVPIPKAEMESGLRAAAMASLGETPGKARRARLGTAYLVRLCCGGVTYVFQQGRQTFNAGDRVNVQHGLKPSISRR